MTTLVTEVYQRYSNRGRKKTENSQRTALAAIFGVPLEQITESLLVEKLLASEEKRIEESRKWQDELIRQELERDFAKRQWYAEHRAEVEQFPEFVAALFYADQLPAAIKNKMEKGVPSWDRFQHLHARVRTLSYARCDFGRAQRTHPGINVCHPDIASVKGRRTVCGGQYSSRCTYKKYDYYADYTCIFSPDGKKLFYRLADGTEKTISISPAGWARIEGEVVRPPAPEKTVKIRNRDVFRAFQDVLGKRNKIIKIEWDGKAKYFQMICGSEEYHFGRPSQETLRKKAEIEKIITTAVTAFRRRRIEKISEARLVAGAGKTFVSLADSLNSGNCEPLTREFARRMWERIGAVGECAVRGDLILSERNDNYTKRAVSYALNRKQMELLQ